MEEEVWKDIYFTDFDGILHDYRGKYQISNRGRLRGFTDKQGNINKEPVTYFNPQPQTNGYICFHLRDGKGGNKYVKAHKLVAFMFIPIPEELMNIDERLVINHKNEIKHDNRVENLEWCTQKYNTNYGTHNEKISKANKGRKFTEEWIKKLSESRKKQVIAIHVETKEKIIFDSVKDVSEYFNIQYAYVSRYIKKQRIVNNYVLQYK